MVTVCSSVSHLSSTDNCSDTEKCKVWILDRSSDLGHDNYQTAMIIKNMMFAEKQTKNHLP